MHKTTALDKLMSAMGIDAIVGLQRGDEGKGRFVDMLAGDYDIVARFNGGSNAGHTVVQPNGQELDLHQVPSGIVHEGVVNVIGNGTLLNPIKLVEEIDYLRAHDIDVIPKRNLFISSGVHLVLPHHISLDEIREAGESRQGSTKNGISPAAAQKADRKGVRAEEINNDVGKIYKNIVEGLQAQIELRREAGLEPLEEAEDIALDYIAAALKLGSYITDTVWYLNNQLEKKDARVLAEGAQGFWLDPEHGMHPYVTSTPTTTGGILLGLGVGPEHIERVIGVTKVVQSHVGDGPFVTEVHDQTLLDLLHGDKDAVDGEVGTTTGRVRRLGYLDLPQLRRANMVNGTTEIAVTKLDWLSRYGEEIPVCVDYVRKGKPYSVSPDSARKLEQCEPQYSNLEGWSENIQDVTRFEDLPEAAQDYIEFLEKYLSKDITMIGVGPQRDQVITR